MKPFSFDPCAALRSSASINRSTRNDFRQRVAPLIAAFVAALLIPTGQASAQAQSQSSRLSVLYTFSAAPSHINQDGTNPTAALTPGSDGNFYGTAYGGGQFGDGTVFKLTPSGVLTTLYSFDGTTGAKPRSGIIQGSDGNFYGTAIYGGLTTGMPIGNGTVYKITPAGACTVLHQFTGYPNDGSNPAARLVEGSDGNFYGTTSAGGTSNNGTVFKMTPAGALTTLVSFNDTNGSGPTAALVEGGDSDFYGTTASGGSLESGTIFKITPSGTLTTLVNLDSASGYNAEAGLVLGSDGDFYGVTESGGGPAIDGTVYMVSPIGTLTVLAVFTGTNGANPVGTLVEGANGDFYGTTDQGGQSYSPTGSPGYGTVFEITPAGMLTTLASFTDSGNPLSGKYPESALVIGHDGCLYGTTSKGGASGTGTIFKVTLPPTITGFSPQSGHVGTLVTITGMNLTGTSIVGFENAHAASFTVSSDGTQITTTVPIGAVTGPVAVLTNGIEAKSPTSFTVTL